MNSQDGVGVNLQRRQPYNIFADMNGDGVVDINDVNVLRGLFGTSLLTLTSVSPASGAQGGTVPVTLTGTAFYSGQTVASSNPQIAVSNVTIVSATQITATLAIASSAAIGPANITVIYNGGPSNAVSFTVTPPASITGLSPTSGPVGAPVTITGTNFGATQGTSTMAFNDANAGTASSWSATSITVAVSAGATTGNVVVTVGGAPSNGSLFTVPPPPTISSLSPASGWAGMLLNISGSNFGTSQGTNTVTFNGVDAGKAVNWQVRHRSWAARQSRSTASARALLPDGATRVSVPPSRVGRPPAMSWSQLETWV